MGVIPNKRPFWDAYLVSAFSFQFVVLASLCLYIRSDILELLRKE